jgi:hypothetical protein
VQSKNEILRVQYEDRGTYLGENGDVRSVLESWCWFVRLRKLQDVGDESERSLWKVVGLEKKRIWDLNISGQPRKIGGAGIFFPLGS